MSYHEHCQCDLCCAAPEEVVGSFFILTCRSCGVPMIVLRDHRPTISMSETDELLDIMRTRFPGWRARGKGMRDIPEHWHEHLLREG